MYKLTTLFLVTASLVFVFDRFAEGKSLEEEDVATSHYDEPMQNVSGLVIKKYFKILSSHYQHSLLITPAVKNVFRNKCQQTISALERERRAIMCPPQCFGSCMNNQQCMQYSPSMVCIQACCCPIQVDLSSLFLLSVKLFTCYYFNNCVNEVLNLYESVAGCRYPLIYRLTVISVMQIFEKKFLILIN